MADKNAVSLGNRLNRTLAQAKSALFEKGEQAQLTYGAFDSAIRTVMAEKQDKFEYTYPVGYRPNRTTIDSSISYTKEELLGKYHSLANLQLPINFLVHLVTIVETMFGDIIRDIVIQYPKKLGAKRTVTFEDVIHATSIEEIQLRVTDLFLNELSYKSPTEFSEALKSLLSINLLECPAFHKYIEMKASRDIFIHNRGITNDIYIRKAGSHARAKVKQGLPADNQYFLESYESCLQLTEWLEEKLNEHWPSSELEEREKKPIENPQVQPVKLA